MRVISLFTLVLLVLSSFNLYAANFACKPSYSYEGWMPKRVITLNSTYYRGYGPSKEEAQAEAVFLCQRVYKHCTADATGCKQTTSNITRCWVRHQLVSGYHHDRNAASWIAKNRCLHDHLVQSGASSCFVSGCQQAKKNAAAVGVKSSSYHVY